MQYGTVDSDIQETLGCISDISGGLSGKTVLLTGSCGFLGRWLAAVFEALNASLDEPCRLIGLDNFVTGKDAQLPATSESFRFVEHDIIRPWDPEEKVDFVVHAAGIASPRHYRARPLETVDVAVNGTRNMLELARKNGARFAFFSSCEIYGNPDAKNVPTPESYRGYVGCQGPRACYDESKRVAETLCYIYHEEYGVSTNVIRPFNVYGPGMSERDYRVLPNFASQLKRGQPLQVYGGGDQTRTYCYITDALNGFVRVLIQGLPGETYNIGNPEPEISVLGLVDASRQALGRDLAADIVAYPDSYPADEPQRRCPDIRKAREHLNYEPMVDLIEGLRRFYVWAEEHYTGES